MNIRVNIVRPLPYCVAFIAQNLTNYVKDFHGKALPRLHEITETCTTHPMLVTLDSV